MRRLAALLLLAALAGLASGETPPYRGWQRDGGEPLAPDEWLEIQQLPNRARVLVRVSPRGKAVVAVAPEPFRLAKAGAFPHEKEYRDLAARADREGLAILLDKVLISEEAGRVLLRPPWESPVWISARTLARERLLELGPEARAAWRKLRDAEATQRFEAAARRGDASELDGLLDRYPLATTSAVAALRAGDLYLEQGDLVSARRAWERARSAETTAAIDSRLAQAALLEGAREERAFGAAWARDRSPLRPLWRRKIVAPDHAPCRLPGVLAVADGDAAFIQDARSVLALELETGRLLWRTPVEKIDRPEEESAATVSVSAEEVACVRGRRRAYLLERSTGRVVHEIDVARDLEGTGTDRIDAAASDRGLFFIVASVAGDRVVAAYDRRGKRVFRSELWPAGSPLQGPSTTFIAGRGGIFVLADGGVAALDRTGDVLWARAAESLHADPGRSPERTLARSEHELFVLGKEGLTVLDPDSGSRLALPALPPGLLAVATGDDGPVFLQPKPPEGAPQLLATFGRHVFIVALVDEPARPAWPGTLQDGILWLPGDSHLVAIELATGSELGRARFEAGPGLLSAAGDVALSARDDEVVAYAPRPPPGELGPAPEDPESLVQELSSRDPRARQRAREKLRLLGPRAKTALEAAAAGTSAEARDAASELLPWVGLRDLWAKALTELAIDADPDALLAAESSARIRALRRAHGGDKDPAKGCSPLLAALRAVVLHDGDLEVRSEALSWLVARDWEVRDKVVEILTDPMKEAPARAAAAEALVDSGAARREAPGHKELVDALSGSDEVRRALYRELLRHGGASESGILQARVMAWKDKDGNDRKADSLAFDCIREWQAETNRNPRAPLDTQAAAARRLARDESRRELLARIKLE